MKRSLEKSFFLYKTVYRYPGNSLPHLIYNTLPEEKRQWTPQEHRTIALTSVLRCKPFCVPANLVSDDLNNSRQLFCNGYIF